MRELRWLDVRDALDGIWFLWRSAAMTTGTGLLLLGMWICAAAMWHSKVVAGWAALIFTFAAFVVTFWMAQ